MKEQLVEYSGKARIRVQNKQSYFKHIDSSDAVNKMCLVKKLR